MTAPATKFDQPSLPLASKIVYISLLAVSYFVMARLGLDFAVVHTSISAVWPASGTSLAAVFLWGSWAWPGVFLGSFAANYSDSVPAQTSALIAMGSTLSIVWGAELLHGAKSFNPRFSKTKDVLIFGLLGAGVSSQLSASIGVFSLWFAGLVTTPSLGSAWLAWWTGDAMGILVVTPFILVMRFARWQRPTLNRAIEALLLFGPFTLVAAVVFTRNELLTFLIYPFVIWAAIRFQQVGVVTLALILACVSIPLLILEVGPKAMQHHEALSVSIYRLQLFLSTASLAGMLLAAITADRSATEMQLKRSEEQFRILFEKAPIGITRFDNNSVITKCNARLCEILRAPESHILGINILSIVKNVQLTAAIKNALHGKISTFEGEYTSIIGAQNIIIRSVFTPLYNADGTIDGGICITEDISSWKRVAEFKMAQRIARVGSWWLDINSQKVEWTDELYEILGLDPSLPPPNYSEHSKLFTPDSWEKLNKTLSNTRKTGQSYEIELEMVRDEKKDGWMLAFGEVVRNSKGVVIGLRGAAQDITELKRVEQQLRKSEDRLKAIIANEPECVKILNFKGEVLEMNPAGIAMLEAHSLEEVKSYPLSKFILPQYHIPFFELHQNATKGSSGKLEFEIVGLQGTHRWLETHAVPIRDQDSDTVMSLSITRDITVRKRAELELIAAKEAAEDAAKSKSMFLDIAAHELRTPITAFSLLLQLTQRQLEKGVAVTKEQLDRLRLPVDRLSRLVVDLLDVSRLERGFVVLHTAPTDIAKIISSCLDEFKLQNPRRQFSFQRPEQPVVVDIDYLRLNQVLANLLDNATKYSPPDTPITLFLEVLAHTVRVSVIDQGATIPEEQKNHLFTAFGRGNSDATIRTSGLGLGLSVCRGIIKLHGGTIGIGSGSASGSGEKGGNIFYFDLPKKENQS